MQTLQPSPRLTPDRQLWQGNNQFYNVLPWVLVATVVVTLMIQV